VLPLVGCALLGFTVAAYVMIGPEILLALASSVAGAAIGRLINLRDQVKYGSQVREFLPLFLAQLAIGAVSGLVVSVAATLPLLNLGSPTAVAALSFAAGLSEATFLKLVSRIGGEPA
jgi:hypothetical protein